VTAQLARIKTANPQALLTWTVGTPMGTLLRGVRDIGLDVPVVAANGNMLFTEMTQFANILPREYLFPAYRAQTEGTTAAGPIRDAQTSFFRAMKAAGLRPDIASVLCWDAIMIVVDALEHVGPDASAQQLREYINGLHGFAGVNGLYDFRGGDQRGLSASAIVVDRWDAAKNAFVSISTAGGAPR
jgi:branched-chain amino acid transport system substrate-binding protein